MLIVEDISYSLDDVIKSLRDELGFSYVEGTENSGYINLGRGIKLNLVFNEMAPKIESAKIVFPNKEIDMLKNASLSEIYATAIESADQVLDLINRMLGGNKDEEDID